MMPQEENQMCIRDSFVTFLGMGVSLLAGVLTLAVLTLPVIINTTEEALRQVPDLSLIHI